MEDVLILQDGVVAVHAEVDLAGVNRFIVRGPQEQVRALIGAREVLTERHLGNATATVRGQAGDADRALARRPGSPLSPPPCRSSSPPSASALHDRSDIA